MLNKQCKLISECLNGYIKIKRRETSLDRDNRFRSFFLSLAFST